MNLEKFLTAFAEQLDDTDASLITPDCEFHDLDEWSSLTGMAIIAMVRTEFDKSITGKEIRGCNTIEDLYNLVNNK